MLPFQRNRRGKDVSPTVGGSSYSRFCSPHRRQNRRGKDASPTVGGSPYSRFCIKARRPFPHLYTASGGHGSSVAPVGRTPVGRQGNEP